MISNSIITDENGQKLIYVSPEEFDFFVRFLKKKGINWTKEHKEASVVVLSKSLTGYIKTPLRTITIEPKYKEINLSHVFRLYNYVYSYEGVQDEELLDITESTKSENIVKSFLRRLRENISIGILQDYSPIEQQTSYLKGNVNYVSTYKNILLSKKYPVVTKVFSLTPNVEINKLIVGALQLISTSGNNSTEALELLSYYNNVSPIKENASEYLKNIRFNSKNNRFKRVASDAAMIIDSLYYDSFKGTAGGESFLINFDLLFEEFVKKILFQETTERHFVSWNEPKLFGTEYSNGFAIRNNFYQPDILYKFNPENEEVDFQPSAEAVLDVKNKANSTFKNADIYQILVYNQLLYAKKSILIYPSFYLRPSTKFIIENNKIHVPEIHSVFIEITKPDAEEFKNSINAFIEEVYNILD